MAPTGGYSDDGYVDDGYWDLGVVGLPPAHTLRVVASVLEREPRRVDVKGRVNVVQVPGVVRAEDIMEE